MERLQWQSGGRHGTGTDHGGGRWGLMPGGRGGGARLILIVMALLCLRAAPEWAERGTAHFTILYQPQSARLVDRVLPDFETQLARVTGLLRTGPPAKITVVLAPDARTFSNLAGGAPPWVSGMAYPERAAIYLRPLSGMEVRHASLSAVIAHEITHVVLYHKLNGRHVPRWLDEGLAVFMADEPLYSRAETLAQIGLTGRYIPFRRLEYDFPDNSDDAATAYAESGDFIRFLYHKYGNDAFNRYLDLIAQGADPDQALQEAFHSTLFPLETEWLHGVRWAYGLIPALSGGAMLWALLGLLSAVAYFRKSARMKEVRKDIAAYDYKLKEKEARRWAARRLQEESGEEDDFYEYVEEEEGEEEEEEEEEDDDLPPGGHTIH
jgi:hypothetical protein